MSLPDTSAPIDPAEIMTGAMRQHLDDFNRRFHALSADLGRIDSTLAHAMGDELENIEKQRNDSEDRRHS